ncbi:MAG: hypothetical protein N2316_08615 [Spirochaetes bacterium]|nr:hypothetical protein [Spirochaetota bacterium]
MKRQLFRIAVVFAIMGVVHQLAEAALIVDVEGGKVFTGYNDVRIPGTSGTKFSLSEEVESESTWYWRGRIGYLVAHEHFFTFLVAPLRIEGSGKIDRDILFENTIFPAQTPLRTAFQFNTYRVGYRYNFISNERGIVGGGITLLVRDAYIEVEGGGQSAKSSNLGFVPLLNFHVSGRIIPQLGVLVEGEALASKQGRAFDILTALVYYISDSLSAKAGYRFIEGGADNNEVYTFSLFHFAVGGIELRW